MTGSTAQPTAAFDPADIARRFVAARRAAKALAAFPGPIPADLAAGYACQDEAIALWPDEIVGWKVGRIAQALQAELGAERVAGPVFKGNLSLASSKAPTPLPVIIGGFAAIEAEYIYRIGKDAPAGQTRWSLDEALDLVDCELVGVEFAGSPLASINELGPRVVAADFGNNSGLILGGPVPDWRARADNVPPCEVFIEGTSVGRGSPAAIPGGPAASLIFLLGLAAARGRPLKRGQLVTTGAATGIHDIEVGQTARISFGELGEIRCIAVPAEPAKTAGENKNDDHRLGYD